MTDRGAIGPRRMAIIITALAMATGTMAMGVMIGTGIVERKLAV